MKTITLSDEDYEFLMNIKHELLTQDNRCTADVCFQVRDKKKIFGMDSEYCEDYEWRKDFETYFKSDDIEGLFESIVYSNDDDDYKYDKENFFTDEQYREDLLLELEFEKVYYCEEDVIVQTCLTEKYADIYLHNQKHNLSKDAFIYGESFYRNYEMQNLRKILMKIE